MTTTFRFYRYNPLRHARRREAAQMDVYEDGENVGCLWMSVKDIKNNIIEFGDSPEFQKALKAYRDNVAVTIEEVKTDGTEPVVSLGRDPGEGKN